MDTVKTKTWIAVDPAFEFTEHETMQAALEVNPFILFLEKVGTWKNGAHNNYAYGVEFYNKEGLKVDGASINNWRVVNVRISDSGYYGGYAKWMITFSIIDPWGTSIDRYFGNGRAGVTNALIFLRAVSPYYSWAELRKEDPVEKEKSEIHSLKEVIYPTESGLRKPTISRQYES